MNDRLVIRIENSMHSIALALDQVEKWLTSSSVPSKTRNFARLAIEELATNWIKYGCHSASEQSMSFELQFDKGLLVLQSKDNGAPFNPLLLPEPETTLPLHERNPGGLGILLLRKLADHISYAHRNGMNLLRIEKTFHPPDHEQT